MRVVARLIDEAPPGGGGVVIGPPDVAGCLRRTEKARAKGRLPSQLLGGENKAPGA